MQIVAILIQALVLFGSTITILFIDRKLRASKGELGGMYEPELSTVLALCILCNLGCLPYYFYSSRRSALWGLVGVGFFLACVAVSFVAGLVVQIAIRLL